MKLLTKSQTSISPQLASARYIGYVGYENLGDEALFAAIKNLFADKINLDASKNPGLIENILSFYKGVFLGGGTLIKAPSMQYKRVKQALMISPRAKFIVFGTGVGDPQMWSQFGHETDKQGWCRLLKKADYLAVRGPISKQYLEDWGINKEIKVVGDPALLFAREKIQPKSKSKSIGLNFLNSGSKQQIHGQNEAAVRDYALSLIKYLKDESWKITLFPMAPQDEIYLTELLKDSGLSDIAIFRDYRDTNATLDALNRQDVFVGERLHSVILASCAYVPAIMIEYRTKCKDFMLSIDRGFYNCRTDDLNLDKTIEQIDDLYSNIEHHQEEIFQKIKLRKNVLEQAANEVLQIISP